MHPSCALQWAVYARVCLLIHGSHRYFWYTAGPVPTPGSGAPGREIPCTALNRDLSKFFLPFVIFFQPVVLSLFPSDAFPG